MFLQAQRVTYSAVARHNNVITQWKSTWIVLEVNYNKNTVTKIGCNPLKVRFSALEEI